MRAASLALLISTTLVGTAAAQGVKDPANFGMSGPKTQTQTKTDPSRPTAIQNAPTNMLPPGTAVQRVYRDGKMQTIVR